MFSNVNSIIIIIIPITIIYYYVVIYIKSIDHKSV